MIGRNFPIPRREAERGFLLLISEKIFKEFITKALFYFLFIEVIEVMKI